jgi:AraC-like DNA-binding protein
LPHIRVTTQKTKAELQETHVLGDDTHQVVLRADERDPREWLRDALLCPLLSQHRIAHMGICHARTPYQVVRTKQSGAYFLACFGGEGQILVDGRWKRCAAGTACLLPPGILNAFRAVPRKQWDFVWIRYQQPAEQRPIVVAGSPVMAKFNCEAVRAAAEGLYHECRLQPLPAAIHHWVELVQGYVLRFARPYQVDDRLWKLWELVESDLSAEWSLEKLAGLAHVSAEHLRRLCRHTLGRSPMHHVTYLRMRRAAELLATTDDKIEVIATAIGYQNPFVFSTTFKKWIGWRPSEHRQRSSPA